MCGTLKEKVASTTLLVMEIDTNSFVDVVSLLYGHRNYTNHIIDIEKSHTINYTYIHISIGFSLGCWEE
jgi:hypothetical protein